jgi:hypothetical protein
MLGYWTFFPAEAPWGRIPVMGYAEVVASTHDAVREGERLFGFYPMATHLVVTPARIERGLFEDGAEHRQATALAYRQYLRAAVDPQYRSDDEDGLLLLRGLFLTSFLVDDFLGDQGYFGAERLLVSSASSKTAIALAFQASRRTGLEVVGLTSPRNVGFVEGLGCFSRVVPYEAIGALAAAPTTVFVDHAGSRAVVAAVHERCAAGLRHSAVVGATHWEGRRPSRTMPGPAPTFFFAPMQMEKRQAEWGAGGFQDRLGAAWHSFREFTRGWLAIRRDTGPEAVARVYQDVLEGRSAPHVGHILSLGDA